MEAALGARAWNAAGLLGVHAAISASDALTSLKLGRHSTGQSHEDAAVLVGELSIEDASQKSEVLNEIIGSKHVVAYEDRQFTEDEAATLAKQVRRFIDWVERAMDEPRRPQ